MVSMRSEAAAGRIPLTTFKGQLRQINAASAGSDGLAVLRLCVPRFFELDGAADDAATCAANRAAAPMAARTTFRRYSGKVRAPEQGGQLPRERYFSVASGPDGDDAGVLAEELNAYRSLRIPLQFFDLMRDEVAVALDTPRGCQVLLFVHEACALQPFAATFSAAFRAAVDAAATTRSPFLLSLGTTVVDAEIGGVLDLRLPAAQRWFFASFVQCGMLPTPARCFEDVLPELLALACGGSTPDNRRLQALGEHLRARGVRALIYPSARCDVAVRYRDGALVAWHGWNLVRYGPAPLRDSLYIDLGAWETQFPPSVELRRYGGDGEEGWRVCGLRVWNHSVHAMRRRLP
ncbi:MAG: hypothetical protein BGP24_03775 [Lysobacterales bacterium 69-70]|nr:hypothetical protein [Xanthomonadaceae bacterium]ODU32131.1 MAG: hypothetical protein ABS97_18040 [Xanthomonadaceae bacterium SCN 69-320]ODV18991.1 MAG: hypothetical protein ABT27_12185 [Xanthomonadaceae bacterium SCN 69-25]OJZ01853.1 MAG: hypothetical protein BGP24_03775 [Xanthomonadales bacterium 69-70]